VRNKISGTWGNTRILSTSGLHCALAQGNPSQTSSGGALAGWHGTSGTIYIITANTKTNNTQQPSALAAETGRTVSAVSPAVASSYARGLNLDLSKLGIEGLQGDVTFLVRQNPSASFVPVDEIDSFYTDYLRLKLSASQGNTIPFSLGINSVVVPAKISRSLLNTRLVTFEFADEAASPLSAIEFKLGDLIDIWRTNFQTANGINFMSCERNVPISASGTMNVHILPAFLSDTSNNAFLEVVGGEVDSSTVKPAEDEKQIRITEDQLPASFRLSQNYPNPFNPTTMIRYELPKDSYVSLRVFDMLGRVVATLVDGQQTCGYHEVEFDGSKLASGVYIYRLSGTQGTITKKMLLTK
ncbi:MAG: hypothetical protein B7Z63_06450, partial [Ignavibacteriae bacterium 37-53-5]